MVRQVNQTNRYVKRNEPRDNNPSSRGPMAYSRYGGSHKRAQAYKGVHADKRPSRARKGHRHHGLKTDARSFRDKGPMMKEESHQIREGGRKSLSLVKKPVVQGDSVIHMEQHMLSCGNQVEDRRDFAGKEILTHSGKPKTSIMIKEGGVGSPKT